MPAYAIEYLEAEPGPCCECSGWVGRGPVGLCGGRPLCDGCLTRDCPDLGLLLTMAHLARELSRVRGLYHNRDLSAEGLAVFSTFARMYALHCEGRWPERIADVVKTAGIWLAAVDPVETAAHLDRLAAHLEAAVGWGASADLPPPAELRHQELVEFLELHGVDPAAFFAAVYPPPEPGPAGAPGEQESPSAGSAESVANPPASAGAEPGEDASEVTP